MFVKENKRYAKEIAKLAREIDADEVQINTPLRACGVKPLSKQQLGRIQRYFKDVNYTTAYDRHKKNVKPLDKKATAKRREK